MDRQSIGIHRAALFFSFFPRTTSPLLSNKSFSSTVVLIFLLTAFPAKAIEPTTVIAVNAAVTAFQSLISSSAPRTLDPLSQLYFQQILRNQERISQQLSEITNQITTLAELVDSIPKRIVSLDKEVDAKAVYESAMRLHLSFLEAIRDTNSDIDSTDNSRFVALLNRLERSASEHLAFVQTAGYSFDTIVAIRTLQISLESLIDTARVARFNNDGNKRYLLDSLSLITRAANEIRDGKDTSDYTSFQTDKENARKRVKSATTNLANFKEDYHYRINATKQFYKNFSPPILPKGAAVYYEYRSYYECVDLLSERVVQVPEVPMFDNYLSNCRYFSDGDRYEKNATLRKVQLASLDHSTGHFWLELTPHQVSAKYIDYINTFNKGKVEYLLYSSATILLENTVNRFAELNDSIKGL